MNTLKKVSAFGVLVLVSSSVLAGPNLSFASNANNYQSGIQGADLSTYLNASSGDVSMTATAWSSALHGGQQHCVDPGQADMNAYDRCIHRAELTRYGTSGLGAINIDEGDDTPNHSVDNNSLDYDMILLSFNKDVNLTDLYTGWNYSYKNLDNDGNYTSRTWGNAGASVMAYTGSNFSTKQFSSTTTWADTLSQGWSVINEDFKSSGSYQYGSKWLQQLPITSTNSPVFSKYWLVGAAHNISRDAGNITDHIKIAGVSFVKKPNTPDGNGNPVNAPATFGLFSAFMALAMYRRKKA